MKTSKKNNWYALKTLDPKNESSPVTEAELSIYDEIGGWGVTAKDFQKDLASLPESVETINMHISSPGGSIVHGNVIYNLIKDHKAHVITHIDGLAASMASVIALAGDEVHMAENAIFVIHNPATIATGDADELRKKASVLDKMKANISNAYSRSNYSPEELDELMDAETWFTAAEAKEAGFIDHIENAFEAAALASALDTDFAKNFKVPNKYQPTISAQYATLDVQHKALQEEAQSLREENQGFEDTISELTAKIETHEAQLKATIEEHKAALVKAKAITEKDVSDRAAQILAEQGQPPLTEPGDDLTTQAAGSDKAVRDQYKALCKQYPAGTPERSDFFQAHKKILSSGA